MGFQTIQELPKKGVIFLGGHQNMTKKLRQYFPKWCFISEDQLKRQIKFHQKTIFYWTAHCSHRTMRYVYSKLSSDTNIIFVTATNLPLLINEMRSSYQNIAN